MISTILLKLVGIGIEHASVKFFEAEIRDKNADIICIISRLTYEEVREALLNKLIEIYEDNL